MEGNLDNRERQFEDRFAREQETKFRIRAHRDKLFARWTADLLGDLACPGYTEMLIEFAMLHTPDQIIGKVLLDLGGFKINVTEHEARRAFESCATEAEIAILGDTASTRL